MRVAKTSGITFLYPAPTQRTEALPQEGQIEYTGTLIALPPARSQGRGSIPGEASQEDLGL